MKRKDITEDFRVDFTFQREWIEGRGLLLLSAVFLGEDLGAAVFIISLLFNFNLGLIIGFLMVALGKTSTHLLFLGRPTRFWRVFARPQSSWISRGVISMTIFIIAAGFYIGPLVIPSLPWALGTTLTQISGAIAIISGFILLVYFGLVSSYSPSIPFWNTPILPALYLMISLASGIGVVSGLTSITETAINIELLKNIEIALLYLYVIVLGFYLFGMWHSNIGAKSAVKYLFTGEISPLFIGAVIIMGITLPLLIVTYAYFAPIPSIVHIAAAILELIGGALLLRYSIMKAGIYPPVI